MSKKRRIVTYVILGIVVWISVCLVAYFFINRHIKKVECYAFVEDCYEYLETDTTFIDKYGAPVGFSYSECKEIQKSKNKDGNIELSVAFYVEVDTGKKYSIQMGMIFNDDSSDFFYSEVVECE